MRTAITESFSPTLWARWLGFSGTWTAIVDCNGLHITTRTDFDGSLLAVSANLEKGWVWSRVRIIGMDAPLLSGLSHQDARRLVDVLLREKEKAVMRLEIDLQADHDALTPVWEKIRGELGAQRYLTARNRQNIVARVAAVRDQIDAAYARACSPHAASFAIVEGLNATLASLRKLVFDGSTVLTARNERFVKEELIRWRNFFDYCEERPLTDEQAVAAVTFEENTLLVAAAGSGKTSTVVGKVAYALAKGVARPDEVLCLAFNSKAAGEIGDRLRARLTAMTQAACPIDAAIKQRLAAFVDDGLNIESRTFHSLGLRLIKEVEGSKPIVSKEMENKRRLQRAIERCQRDPQFVASWLLLQTVLRFPRPADTRFRSEKEYLEYLRGMWRQRKLGYRNNDQGDGILTLGCTKLVRSFEEVAISNWLYVMGVEFEYEAPYLPGAAILCPGQTWTPDFTYRMRSASGEVVVVHEHFALDAEGKAPSFFGKPAVYEDEARRKQDVLREIDRRHFWTTSAEYRNGTLFEKLEQCLKAAGISLRPRSREEILSKLQEIGQIPDNELIDRAVSQIRQNGWPLGRLTSRLSEQAEPMRAALFLSVVWPVSEAVSALLIEDKRIDYDEMIRRALDYLSKEPGRLPFKFILADEFQDTAPGRGEIIRKMLHAREDSLFFAVGDDWQAINRFAGSDLQFFNGFGAAFNRQTDADARCDLTRTFRSNQGIADVARAFVLRNKSQIPKIVEADDKTHQGVIDVQMYQNDQEVLGKVEETLDRWVAQHPPGTKPSVFLLGRYGEKRVGGLSAAQIEELNARWGDRIELCEIDGRSPTLYLTMHKSKGLQADYVLILGMFRAEHDLFCFPSEREDDPLLQLVLPPKEALADADERRLFYVALTRAKHQVVLLSQRRYPSPYVLELLRDCRKGSVLFNGAPELPPLCPECKGGLVFERYNARTKQPFHACSDQWGCGRTWASWPPSQGARREQRHATFQ
jgi:DNA helicase IV